MRFATLALAAALAAAPLTALAAGERGGVDVVKAKCASCHEKGLHGAPRIDDRAAWIPRMKKGIDATLAAAIKGHGAMPARGGMADLTDAEMRSAILYLFNPAGQPPRPAPAPPVAPNQRVVDGIEVHLGVSSSGGGLSHVNVTLRDTSTKKPIDDAEVDVRITNPVMGTETRKLARGRAGGVVSYGGDFRISGREPHVISVRIRRPDSPRTVEAAFDYRS